MSAGLSRAGVAACLLCACVTGREKGGLVPHPELSEQRLAQLSGKRLAVLIGVDQPRDEAWPRLQYAGADASELSKVLQSDGRFETELLTTVPDTSRANVLAALERLRVKNRSPQDVDVV